MPKNNHVHAPKFYVRLCKGTVTNLPCDFKVLPGAIYGRYTNENEKRVFWVCDDFALFNGKLPVHIFCGYWQDVLVNADHPIYKWVKSACEKLGYIPTVQRENLSFDSCKSMMKTYALHKKGTGSRINTHQINNPLEWNEVTEEAHWYGKGNAGWTVSNIRD